MLEYSHVTNEVEAVHAIIFFHYGNTTNNNFTRPYIGYVKIYLPNIVVKNHIAYHHKY